MYCDTLGRQHNDARNFDGRCCAVLCRASSAAMKQQPKLGEKGIEKREDMFTSQVPSLDRETKARMAARSTASRPATQMAGNWCWLPNII